MKSEFSCKKRAPTHADALLKELFMIVFDGFKLQYIRVIINT